MTRWAVGYRNSSSATVCSILLESVDQLIPSSENIEWPSLEDIKNSQSRSKEEDIDVNRSCDEDGIWITDDRIWIPSNDLELQLKILVCSHCGSSGHRGIEATKSIVEDKFFWTGMKASIEKTVKGCLHCIMTRAGSLIPRPLSHAIHGSRPNEVIHLDFLYLGQGTDQKNYVLILKDDFSSYVWLFPADAATSEVAAESLLNWIASFGAMEWLVSDQGSHFKNLLLEEITSQLKTRHHFTTTYSPWANGTVERVCREVLRSCRALCSEWKLGPQDWPAVLQTVQSILNQAPLQRLGKKSGTEPFRCPLEVFTGVKPSQPLMRAVPPSKYIKANSIDDVRLQQIVQIEQVQMHRKVAGKITHSRKIQIESHNRKTNVQSFNADVGDFVLVRGMKPGQHKMSFKWVGPRRILEVRGHMTFFIENLIDGKTEVVHVRRILKYRASLDGTEVDHRLLGAARHSETTYQVVKTLLDAKLVDGDVYVEVEWEGLPYQCDHTWELASQIKEDLPAMFITFSQEYAKDENIKKLLVDMTHQ